MNTAEKAHIVQVVVLHYEYKIQSFLVTTRHGLSCHLFIYFLQLTTSYACRICDVPGSPMPTMP